jgi:hypothetical protein
VDARVFYQEKVEYLKQSLERLQTTITTKQDNLRVTVDVMQYKLADQKKTDKA